jgi:hypothetical protein
MWMLVALIPLFLCAQEKIHVLLSNPRSVTTAFELSMKERGDLYVYHEPWTVVLISQTPDQYVLQDDVPSEFIEAKNYQGMNALLYQRALNQPVFLKDFAWAAGEDLVSDCAFLADNDVTLAILIREPAATIESYCKVTKSLCEDKVRNWIQSMFRYDLLLQVAEKYKELRGTWPTIIESETLCSHPKQTMQRYCMKVGIPFMESSLQWQTGPRDELKHFSMWHKDAENSGAFFLQKKAENRFVGIPESILDVCEQVYQEQLPYYNRLVEILSKETAS